MLTKNINFKNFFKNKKRNNIIQIFENIKKNFFLKKDKLLSSLSEGYQYSFDKKFIQKFKKFSSFRIIGMGGSILGIEAIHQFLKHKIKKDFYFVNNLQSKIDLFQNNKKKVVNIIISKSGNTLETISNSNIILKNTKKTLILFFCGILIVTNWFTWIYAVVTNRLVDASFGYYIFPILSVFFGIIFLKESYNKKKLLAISLVIISIIFLLFNFQSTPWVGLIVAITWSTYNLIRKKLKVPPDIGLFIESAFMTPFAIIVFYLLSKDGNNFFSPSDLKISFWLFLAGAMTLIPLYLYLKGVELAGLGPTGMIFFLAPTGQFLLGIFYYGEYLDINKLISFVIIWIAVTIYLHDLSGEKVR